jgi:PKD repeat protein
MKTNHSTSLAKVLMFLLLTSFFVGCHDDNENPPVEENPILKEEIKKMTVSSSSGCTVSMESGAKIEIPSNALSSDREITLTIINSLKKGSNTFPDDTIPGFKLSPLLRCEPSGLVFAQPIKITLPIFEEIFTEGVSNDDIIIIAQSSTSLDTIREFTINSLEKTVSFTSTHFTDFAIRTNSESWIITNPVINKDINSNFLTFSYSSNLREKSLFGYWITWLKLTKWFEYIEQDISCNIGLYRKKFLGSEFIAGKQVYKYVVGAGVLSNLYNSGSTYVIDKGTNYSNDGIFSYDKLPSKEDRTKIFKVTSSSSGESEYAALMVISFDENKKIVQKQFVKLGDSFGEDFFIRPTIDGKNYKIPLVDVNVLSDAEKYFFTIEIVSNGDIHNDNWRTKGDFKTTNFAKSEIGNILVQNEPPKITLKSPTPNSAFNFGQSISFSCTVSDKEDTEIPNNKIKWYSSKDNLFGTGNSLTYSQLSIGIHKITVIAEDEGGAKSKAECQIEIGNKPVADFTASPRSIIIGQSVQFTDLSTNSPAHWQWDLGDGSGIITSQNPNHTYNKTGSFTVILYSDNRFGQSGKVKENYITVLPSSGTIPTNGLVAYYPFNGNANDLSGNNNNGTLHGGITATLDRHGTATSAYNFDGIDDYIDIPHSQSLNISQQISISIWIYPESSGPYYYPYHIIEKGNYWGFGQREYDLSYGIITANGEFGGWNNFNLQAGRYYHYVVTFDGSELRTYLNGVFANSVDASGSILTSQDRIFVGRYYLNEYYNFDGVLDDLRIYNRALTQQEITALFNE